MTHFMIKCSVLAQIIIFCLAASGSVVAGAKTVKCDAVNTPVGIEVEVPSKIGELPKMDFNYPVSVTSFSFRDSNLLLIAMDQADFSRTRIVVSAQLNERTGKYEGQLFTDEGGNEIQLDNGPVTCVIK